MTTTDLKSRTIQSQATACDTEVVAHGREVLDIEIKALMQLRNRLDARFEQAVDLMGACMGRIIITGMGKSGIIGKKIAATLSSTGTPRFFLRPGEGMHGDLGLLMWGDVVVAISNSGETPELLNVLPVVKKFECPLIAMTGKTASTLANRADVVLDVSVEQEACALNLAPTASTTTTLAMGDALAVALMKKRGFTEEDFAVFHPAGSLGKRLLLRVEDVMRRGDQVPFVLDTDAFKETLMEITSKKMGMTLVRCKDGKTVGILTDGDVRRILMQDRMPDLATTTVEAVMSQ
ncbi:MAG: KpsF/GutQ family sugar-phosphate isomerase, partial [Cyanobacteria bacterium HKST-UBA05]|nr:KpsF/GutQ family sugar-phosphate isomerase [Cyanobacteria bacterium HKST-UBA05]